MPCSQAWVFNIFFLCVKILNKLTVHISAMVIFLTVLFIRSKSTEIDGKFSAYRAPVIFCSFNENPRISDSFTVMLLLKQSLCVAAPALNGRDMVMVDVDCFLLNDESHGLQCTNPSSQQITIHIVTTNLKGII